MQVDEWTCEPQTSAALVGQPIGSSGASNTLEKSHVGKKWLDPTRSCYAQLLAGSPQECGHGSMLQEITKVL